MSEDIKIFKTWNNVDWSSVNQNVCKAQYRIFDESNLGNTKRVHKLQKILANTIWAKLSAVHKVTTLNKTKKTVGVDGKFYMSQGDKLALAKRLRLDGKSLPIKRAFPDKLGKANKQPPAIPTIEDKAKQALAKILLEPQWESKFEPGSYGFRPGRSPQDAMADIFIVLSKNVSKWVFSVDLRKCFDKIDHDVVLEKLETYPEMRKQIKSWLRAGIMEGYANTLKDRIVITTDDNTSRGAIISPLLANIALHGLEFYLKKFVATLPGAPYPGGENKTRVKTSALGVVRYADDLILIHRNKNILESCIKQTKSWLQEMGLDINKDKSSLKEGTEGFKFLGFQFCLIRKKFPYYKIKIYPSKESQKSMLDKVRNILITQRAISTYALIEKLRPIILGWAKYYNSCECQRVFSKQSYLIFQKLRAWVFRRDRKNNKSVIKERYFPSHQTYVFDGRLYKDNWILTAKIRDKQGKQKTNFLPNMAWVKSQRHIKVKQNASCFDKSLSLYWMERVIRSSTSSLGLSKLFKVQRGNCGICKNKFHWFDSMSWEIDHKIPKSKGGLDHYKNLQLVHKGCHLAKNKKERTIK